MKRAADLSLTLREAKSILFDFTVDHLPAAICILDEDGETLYRPMRKARISELRSAIRMRRKQIGEDISVANRLVELLDLRVSQGAGDEDLVLPDEPTGSGLGQQIAA